MAIVLGSATLVGSPSMIADPSASIHSSATLVGSPSMIADGIVTKFISAPTPTGGMHFGGIATCSVKATITILRDFTWNIRGKFVITKEFTWQTGLPPLYWYRVVGKCITPNCYNGNVQPAESCSSFFQTEVLARSIGGPNGVCEQLRNKKQIWPIATIHKHSRPAEPAQIEIDESNGISHFCERLIPQSFCEYPPCIDFCVDVNGNVSGGLSVFGSVVKVFSYSGGGSIRLAGAADSMILPIRYRGAGGVTMGGAARVKSSNWRYRGSGGITMGGVARVVSSNWMYTTAGGITMGGSTGNPHIRLRYTGAGGPFFGGIADSKVVTADFIADPPTGGVILGSRWAGPWRSRRAIGSTRRLAGSRWAAVARTNTRWWLWATAGSRSAGRRVFESGIIPSLPAG